MNPEEDKNKLLLQKQLKNLADKTEHIKKMMKRGKDTIVLRIGPEFVQFGFADQKEPFMIPSRLVHEESGFSSVQSEIHSANGVGNEPSAKE